jgi:hypothetical protein
VTDSSAALIGHGQAPAVAVSRFQSIGKLPAGDRINGADAAYLPGKLGQAEVGA